MDLLPAIMIDGFDFAERRRGVKTEFCPNVAGFCPGVSGNLTWSGRFLSCCALCLKWIDAIYAGCFREQGVKIDGFSGECGALVRFVCWCLFPISRARARLGTGYGEAGVDQGEFIQLLVGEVQYGVESFLRKFGLLLSQFPARVARPELHSGLPSGGVFDGRDGRVERGLSVWPETSCCLRQSRILSGTTRWGV